MGNTRTKLFTSSRIVVICLLFFTGINALVAGFLFIIDPSGQSIGMSTSYLSNSPFNNFLIPGITLFIVNGLMNIVTAILCLKNYKHYSSWISIQGLLLSGWILIQVLFVRDFNVLHFSMLMIGFVLIFLGTTIKNQLKKE